LGSGQRRQNAKYREIEMRELIEAELDGVAGGRIPNAEGPVTRSDLKSDSWDPHPVDLFPFGR
jgi:hypothetical protein